MQLIAKGFKVGGYTQRIFPPEPSLPTFDPEYVKSYEIGAKTELLDNTLRPICRFLRPTIQTFSY